jgi:type II secretory pathway predicted ATPase ExeA
MVLDYYKLEEQPFGVTPDSRYLFLTHAHKEALSSLIYGIESGCGFVSLIATPGMGKTTLLFEVLKILRDKARIVFLFQTISTPLDLLRSLLSGLGVHDLKGTLPELHNKLRDILTEHYALGKRVVLVIDEAQSLDESVLELVRMLSNFETERDKLIQIILAGQPQLAGNIGSPELVQLRQRISIFARLTPFSPQDTSLYIAHRLRVAGCSSDTPLFTPDALALIALCSDGIPRNINNLCFNALALGCALQQKTIDRDIVRQVISDLDLGNWRHKPSFIPKPEEKLAEKVSVFTSVPETPSVFASWWLKAAVSAVVLIAVSAVLFESGWLRHPVAARPTSAVDAKPSLAAPVPSASPATRTAAPLPAPNAEAPVNLPAKGAVYSTGSTVHAAASVHVEEGQTLLGICADKFGSCTVELLQQIHQLNPWISNPDHIETGQDIRIPVLDAQSRAGERPPRTPSTELGSQ